MIKFEDNRCSLEDVESTHALQVVCGKYTLHHLLLRCTLNLGLWVKMTTISTVYGAIYLSIV